MPGTEHDRRSNKYVGLVTTVIECRVLNMTEEATNIFENGAKNKLEKQFWSLTHSLTTKLISDNLPI